MIKWVTSILFVLLFPLAFWICKYFYPEAFLDKSDPNFDVKFVNSFTDLRYSLFTVWGMLGTTSLYLWVHDPKARIIFSIGFWLCISDIVDRFYFNITKWETNDFWAIILTVILCFMDYKKMFKWSKN